MKRFLSWAGTPVRSRATVLKKRQNSGEKDAFDWQAFLLNLKVPTNSKVQDTTIEIKKP